MRRIVAGVSMMTVAVAAVIGGTAIAGSARRGAVPVGDAQASSGDYVPGEILVKYKRGVGAYARAAVRISSAAAVRSDVPEFRTQLLSLPEQASVEATVSRLNADPRVAFAEPNYRINLLYTPNDPKFKQLWGFDNTGQAHGISDPPPSTLTGTEDADGDVTEAWDTQKGAASTVIAVVDSGVDVTHPDLKANIWVNKAEKHGVPGKDDDKNGYIDDVKGWDTAADDKGVLETTKATGWDHGTHVAGTIAARMDNQEGVVGVCPKCKVMVLKFMKPITVDGKKVMSGNVAAQIEALAYAKKMGADIINGSYGSTMFSLAERNAQASLAAKNILGVYSAANSAGDNDLSVALDTNDDGYRETPISPGYPASYDLPGILSVAASAHDDRLGYFTGCASTAEMWRCSFSNAGQESVDVAAPGVDTLSTVPGGKYAFFNGTSMASPFTAGVAGLIKSEHPEYSPTEIKAAIMNSVDRPAALDVFDVHWLPAARTGSWTRSDGRVNADLALDAPTTLLPTTDGNISGAVPITGQMSGEVSWGGENHDVNDVFKLDLEADQLYSAVLEGSADSSGGSLDLLAYGPGTKEIYQWKKLVKSGRSSSNDESFTFTPTRSGTHFFQVSAFLSDPATYTLSVVPAS